MPLTRVLDLYSRVRDYLLIGATCVAVSASIGWYVTDLKLDAERIGRVADKKAYKQAQAEYTAEATRLKAEQEKKDNERYAKAERDYSDLLRKYDTNLMRLKRTSESKSRGGNLPRPTEGSLSSDRPSNSTEVPTVVISYDDAEICAINTARLQVVHEWATAE